MRGILGLVETRTNERPDRVVSMWVVDDRLRSGTLGLRSDPSDEHPHRSSVCQERDDPGPLHQAGVVSSPSANPFPNLIDPPWYQPSDPGLSSMPLQGRLLLVSSFLWG